MCSLPNPSTQTNTNHRTGTQTLDCPAGQTGQITQTRNEQQTQTRTASCPSAYGSFVWGGWSAWSEWTGTSAWATISNTCAAPTCQSVYAYAEANGLMFFQYGGPGTRAPGKPGDPTTWVTGPTGCMISHSAAWIATFPATLGAEVYWINIGIGF